MKRIIIVIAVIIFSILLSTSIYIITERNNTNKNQFIVSGKLDCDAVFEAFISAVEEKDKPLLSQLFAKNTTELNAFQAQTDSLLELYTGSMQGYSKAAEYTEGERNYGHIVEKTMMSYIVSTTTGQYCVAIQYCTKDFGDEGNIGIQSVYITKQNDNLQATYWGNEEWEKGINIE